MAEVERRCGNCEYYDGGGMSPGGEPRNRSGDCLNSGSPRFTTTLNDTCNRFLPCTTRWPIRQVQRFGIPRVNGE